jgi:uncharacterized protein
VDPLPLLIHGKDDPSDLVPTEGHPVFPDTFLGDPNNYHVFLVHRPVLMEEASKRRLDLQLSGHTHHGQMFPFNLATFLSFGPHHKGLGKVGDMIVNTSSGSGTWGPPMRFLTNSEVVVVTVHSS